MKAKRSLLICVLSSLLLVACGGDGGGGGSSSGGGGGGSGGGNIVAKKLLSRVVTEGVGERTFQYDNQNRLIADSNLGVGNKIEYEGNDFHPSLVANGAPVSIWTCDGSDGNPVSITAAYTQYQYGEDSLFNGVPTKYYQTHPLDQNKKPCDSNRFYRHYLNADGREVSSGDYAASSNFFWGGNYGASYDEHGNLLSWLAIGSCGPACFYTKKSEYTYDDKKGSTSGMTTPLWWFGNSADSFSDNLIANPNNLLSYTVTIDFVTGATGYKLSEETYSYTYDQDGYPTAVDVTTVSRGLQDPTQTTTTSRRTFEYIAAH